MGKSSKDNEVKRQIDILDIEKLIKDNEKNSESMFQELEIILDSLPMEMEVDFSRRIIESTIVTPENKEKEVEYINMIKELIDDLVKNYKKIVIDTYSDLEVQLKELIKDKNMIKKKKKQKKQKKKSYLATYRECIEIENKIIFDEVELYIINVVENKIGKIRNSLIHDGIEKADCKIISSILNNKNADTNIYNIFYKIDNEKYKVITYIVSYIKIIYMKLGIHDYDIDDIVKIKYR